jgi:predicted RNA binding protein YcfA (HicA-like mRNA interferase family)
MMKKGRVTVPVPVHGAQDLGIGLLKKIEKQTGVKLS